MRKTKARELVRFGANVRKLREARDWTQEQLAANAEVLRTRAESRPVSARFTEHRRNDTHSPWKSRDAAGMLHATRGHFGAFP